MATTTENSLPLPCSPPRWSTPKFLLVFTVWALTNAGVIVWLWHDSKSAIVSQVTK